MTRTEIAALKLIESLRVERVIAKCDKCNRRRRLTVLHDDRHRVCRECLQREAQ